MKKEKFKKKGNRVWLNPPLHYDTGALSWTVRVDYSYLEADLSIWDCGRKISLNLSGGSEEEMKQRAEKLNLIIDNLLQMKKAMGEAYDFIQAEDPTEHLLDCEDIEDV